MWFALSVILWSIWGCFIVYVATFLATSAVKSAWRAPINQVNSRKKSDRWP